MPQGIDACDEYLKARTGRYEWRAVRYAAARDAMLYSAGLSYQDTLVDVGAGWTELDLYLRQRGWMGRYIPVDGGIDGTDLETWVPPRHAEWFVALEILEHLSRPWRLLGEMKKRATKGVVLTVPNPRTTDVLGMDRDHKTPILAGELTGWGFRVEERTHYGQPDDSLLAWWVNNDRGRLEASKCGDKS